LDYKKGGESFLRLFKINQLNQFISIEKVTTIKFRLSRSNATPLILKIIVVSIVYLSAARA